MTRAPEGGAASWHRPAFRRRSNHHPRRTRGRRRRHRRRWGGLARCRDVGRPEHVRVRPNLPKVSVLRVVPDCVGIETELVGEEGEVVALSDHVGLHPSSFGDARERSTPRAFRRLDRRARRRCRGAVQDGLKRIAVGRVCAASPVKRTGSTVQYAKYGPLPPGVDDPSSAT
jgi:hypothetical protein